MKKDTKPLFRQKIVGKGGCRRQSKKQSSHSLGWEGFSDKGRKQCRFKLFIFKVLIKCKPFLASGITATHCSPLTSQKAGNVDQSQGNLSLLCPLTIKSKDQHDSYICIKVTGHFQESIEGYIFKWNPQITS